MFVIRKRVNSVNVHIRIGSDSSGTRVSGSAFPFGRQFHSVSFDVNRRIDAFEGKLVPAEANIGFGGNNFSGTQAARVMAAANVAFELGNYYADLINEMENTGYSNVLQDVVNQGDEENFLDCLLIIGSHSQEKDQNGLRIVLKKALEDGRILGMNGPITPDNFESLEVNQFCGLMKLCTLCDRYKLDDESRDGRIAASRKVIAYIHEVFLKEGA